MSLFQTHFSASVDLRFVLVKRNLGVCERITITCFECGKKGHYKNECQVKLKKAKNDQLKQELHLIQFSNHQGEVLPYIKEKGKKGL